MKKIIIAIIIFVAGTFFIASGFLLFTGDFLPDKLEVFYPYVGKYQDGFVSVSDGKKVYYLNNKKKIIYEFKKKITASQMLDSYYYQDGYGIFEKGDKLGIITNKGKELIKPIYHQIEIIDKDTLLVTSEDGSSYFIDGKGKRLSDGNYYNVSRLTNDFFLAFNNGSAGMIDKTGKIVIPLEYQMIQNIPNTFLFVATKQIDLENGMVFEWKNDQIIPLQVPEFTSFIYDDTYLYLRDLQNVNYLYNYKTQEAITLKYSYEILGRFSRGLAYASTNGENVGFINMKEEVIIPAIYVSDITTGFNEYGYAIAAKQIGETAVCGLIDTKNNEILPFIYDDIVILSKDLVAVLKDNVYTLQNITLNKPIENQYTTVETTIRDNLFVVSEGSYDNLKYGLIDEKGNEIYRPIYENIAVYEDQIVVKDGNKSIIDFKN